MSKFVSSELIKIDLGDGDYIKIPKEISFADCDSFASGVVGFEQTLTLVVSLIREWNLKDDESKITEISPENVKRLKLEVIHIIQNAIMERLPKSMLDQKKTENV